MSNNDFFFLQSWMGFCPLVCWRRRTCRGSCGREMHHVLKIGWGRKQIILVFVWINIDIWSTSFCDAGYPAAVCMSALRGAGGWKQAPADRDPHSEKMPVDSGGELVYKRDKQEKHSAQLLSFCVIGVSDWQRGDLVWSWDLFLLI